MHHDFPDPIEEGPSEYVLCLHDVWFQKSLSKATQWLTKKTMVSQGCAKTAQ